MLQALVRARERGIFLSRESEARFPRSAHCVGCVCSELGCFEETVSGRCGIQTQSLALLKSLALLLKSTVTVLEISQHDVAFLEQLFIRMRKTLRQNKRKDVGLQRALPQAVFPLELLFRGLQFISTCFFLLS